MPLLTLIKWWGFLMPMIASIKRLQKALSGAAVLHATLSMSVNDCNDLGLTFSSFCTNQIICLNVCSLSGRSRMTISLWIVSENMPRKVIVVFSTVVLSIKTVSLMWLLICLKRSSVNWQRLEFGGPTKKPIYIVLGLRDWDLFHQQSEVANFS